MLWVHIHTSSHGNLSCIDSHPLSESVRARDTWEHHPSKTADTARHRVYFRIPRVTVTNITLPMKCMSHTFLPIVESQGSPACFCETSLVFSFLQHEAWAVQWGRTWYLSTVCVGLSWSILEGSNQSPGQSLLFTSHVSYAPALQERQPCPILLWTAVLHP